jgi:hypothetical protein
MPRHPIDGMKGSKPRQRVGELSEEYIEIRNRAQRAKAEAAEIALAEKQGTLISKRLAGLQVAFLLTSFRQKVLAAPSAFARRLTAQGLIEAKNEHQVALVLREDLCQMLSELASLPREVMAVGDGNWLAKIDADLLNQVDGDAPRRVTPTQAKAEAAKAKLRREKKTATMRKLRAQGRAA